MSVELTLATYTYDALAHSFSTARFELQVMPDAQVSMALVLQQIEPALQAAVGAGTTRREKGCQITPHSIVQECDYRPQASGHQVVRAYVQTEEALEPQRRSMLGISLFDFSVPAMGMLCKALVALPGFSLGRLEREWTRLEILLAHDPAQTSLDELTNAIRVAALLQRQG
jgi:hypothetical protein